VNGAIKKSMAKKQNEVYSKQTKKTGVHGSWLSIGKIQNTIQN